MTKTDILKLFEAIDRFDSAAMVSGLTEDAVFRFAKIPQVEGKKNIHEFVDNFFKSIKAIRHSGLEVWSLDGVIFVKGRVTYTRHSGTELSVDFSNTFKMRDGKIQQYLIFVDNSTLYTEQD